MNATPQKGRSNEYDGTSIPPWTTLGSQNTTSLRTSLPDIGNDFLEDEQVPERRGKMTRERLQARMGILGRQQKTYY